MMFQKLAYKQLYEGVMASIPASVLLLDQRLRIVSVNRNFLDKSRRNEGSTLGQELAAVFPPVLLAYTRMEARVRKVFTTGQAEGGEEMTYRSPGIPTRVYFYRLVPISDENSHQVEYVMLLMEDITERVQMGEEIRRAEYHLASVVESANDIVVSLDPGGIINTWNLRAEILSGFGRREAQGRPLHSLCAPECQEKMQALLQKMFKGEQGSASIELNLVTKAKNEIPIAWSLSSMRDNNGKVIGFVAVGRDLTESRRMEAQLLQSAKMVSLGVMAGGIAHEIRNPLGICSATAQLLQENLDDPQLIREAAEKIYIAVKRASNIIENLLKFVRPSSDGRMGPLDVNEILNDTLALMSNETTSQPIKTQRRLADRLPQVIGNCNLLQQVFTNLILNAIAAMPTGGQLSVATQLNGAQVLVTFADTGRGIAPEHLGHIFDPFFTTMPIGQGTGLGLSISYAIIQQHKGQITVESQVGVGSTFTVWLPAAEKKQ
jgi:PAS domain S-box-containing protein